MDSFEQVVAEILWMEGYWVRTSVKIDLTKEEKKKIGRPSSPRWELDIVAYNGRKNLLRIVECKSYLDSLGVQAQGFDPKSKNATRYKLFNDATLRETVFGRVGLQFVTMGFCRPNPKIKLCLACGKINERGRLAIEERFKKEGWELWDETWLRTRLHLMSERGYENQTSAVVAKLLLRGKLSRTVESE
jgi:hypothetical protein